MRALVVTELFGPTRGGTAVWFDQVYRRAASAGSEVVTANVPGGTAWDRRYPRRVHRLTWKRHSWLRPESAAIYARLLDRVGWLARCGDFRAIHAGRVLPEGLVSVVAGWGGRLPVVVYAHGEEITGWRDPLKRTAMRWTYRHADAVIANSNATMDLLVELGVERGRIAMIRPGVDVERFGPQVNGERIRAKLGVGSSPLILSVGRLQPRKGFDRVIEALPTVARGVADVQYAIVGRGGDEARLRRLAFEHNVADRVHFAGGVSDDALPEWYAACDVFAMPNRDIEGDTEGFGMVYLEAAASGKGVLAGRDGGTGSAVLDGETGIRVDGHSVVAVAAALSRLLTRHDLAEAMGRQGRDRVCRELTWQQVARRTRQLHDSLVRRREGSGMRARRAAPTPLVR